MKNFDLKKYLSEGKLLKEEVMVNPIIMFGGKKYIKDVISSPDDFGFDEDDAEWVKNNILSSPKMVSIQNYMDLDDKWIKQAQIDTDGGGDLDHVVDGLKVHVKQGLITPEQEKEAMKVVGLAEGKLLKESAPGYDTRKQGEALPTLESVKAAYEAKNDIEEKNDYANSEEDFTDRMVIEKIFDIIRYHELDPSDMLEEIGQEFGIDFEFGAGNGRV